MKGPKDPVDHSRTTRPHAGESMKDNKIMPGLIVIGLALIAFVSALFAHAAGRHGIGVGLGSTSAVLLVVGASWLIVEHLRVRRIEERWHAEHPDAVPQQPSS